MQNIASLTSLRFFAAAMVAFSHIYVVTGMPFAWMNQVILSQGVSFFFILSGFILTVSSRGNLSGHIGAFFAARAARIYPIYFCGLLVGLWVKTLLWGDGVLWQPNVWWNFLLEAAMLQAWLPGGYSPINGVEWSISAEAFFYVIFPTVRRSWKALGCILGISAAFGLGVMIFGQRFGLTPGFEEGSFLKILCFNPLVRAVEFLGGVGLGRLFLSGRVERWFPRSSAAWTCTEILAALLCYGLSHYAFRVWIAPDTDASFGGGWKALLLGMGAAPGFMLLILIVAHERGLVSAALKWRPLVFLGEASYALYIFHLLTFEALRHYGALPLAGSVPRAITAMVSIGLFAILLGISAAAYRYIEHPLRSWLRPRLERVLRPRRMGEPVTA